MADAFNWQRFKIRYQCLISALITTNGIILASLYTNLYNISAVLSLVIAPVCGYIIDYQVHRGMGDALLCVKNRFVSSDRLHAKALQSFHSANIHLDHHHHSLPGVYAPVVSCCFGSTLRLYSLSNDARRRMPSDYHHDVSWTCGSVSSFETGRIHRWRFPSQYIASLLGIMWTTAGIISFASYGLTRLATDPVSAWRVGLISQMSLDDGSPLRRHGSSSYLSACWCLDTWFNYGTYTFTRNAPLVGKFRSTKKRWKRWNKQRCTAMATGWLE